MEVQAISALYCRNICIYSYLPVPIVVTPLTEASGEPISISYHKNIHYNSLVKIEDGMDIFNSYTTGHKKYLKNNTHNMGMRPKRFKVNYILSSSYKLICIIFLKSYNYLISSRIHLKRRTILTNPTTSTLTSPP